MNFKIIPAFEIPLAEQATIANRAFANYIAGWSEMDANALARFLHLQGADLYYSRFVATAEGVAGLAYLNRTGNILRLCGMALIESARGTGAAEYLLNHALEEAKARGDEAMVLEVIEQNPRALAFYRRLGFQKISRLQGWRLAPTSKATPLENAFVQLPILQGLRMPDAREYPELSWPISRHAIARVERTQAFVRANSCVILSDPAPPAIRVHGLFAKPQDWEGLRATLEAVMARFPGKEFFAPPVWPEEYGREIFQPLGFKAEPLSQFFMRREL